MIPRLGSLVRICSRLRVLFIIAIVLGSSIPCFAQHSIEGRVIDEYGEALPYASVVLLNPADSTLQHYDIADDEGHYKITNIKAGNYLMQYSSVAKEVIYEEVTIPSDFVGDKVMKEAAMMDEVVVTAEYVPVQIRQDTVTFNAKAFKTKTGAVVEDLLKEIPGIEVDKAGNMKALGEDVKQVLVDGKEFFGKDPKVATKNLPAEAIDKVEVFDKKSEEAEFMGIDDGVRDRTINLLLNEENKKGYFGNVEAGGGTRSHYKTGGKIYRFSGTLQSALLGMYNDINEFGYTRRDKESWGRQIDGLNTTVAGGLNLSYNVTKYNRYFISYLISSTETILEQETSTENFVRDGSYDQTEDLVEDKRDTPHKANFGVRHRFNKEHNLIIDGDIGITSNNGVSHVLRTTSLDDSLINNVDNTYNSTSDLINVHVRGVDIVKLNEDRTQVKTSVSASYNKNTSGLDWTNTRYNPDRVTIDDRYQDNTTDRLILSVNPTLVQKIKPLWYFSTSVNVGSNSNNLDRKQGILKLDDTFVDSLSTDFSTQEGFVRPSLSLQRSTSTSQFNFSLGTSWSRFDKVLNDGSIGKSDYFYFLPGFSYDSSYRKGRHVRLRYGSSVNMPAANQLLPVLDTVNPLSRYQGNINLTPEYRHNVSLNWSLFDHFSFTSLFSGLSAEYTKDKISWSQTIDEDFTQTGTPVNVPSNYTASSYIYFSTPIRALGMKVNAMSRENWSRGISIINSEDNIQTVFTHTLDLSVENRRKQTFDIAIGGSVSLTDSRSSIAEDNVYFSTSYYTDLRLSPNEQWSFETEANVANHSSRSFSESVSIPFIHASINYYFLKGERASLTLRGSDLLNKNVGFRRISATNYLMQREWNTIGRYVMLTLNMKIGLGVR